MAIDQNPSPSLGTGTVPWWEGPPPPGYVGQWPPPLPPGGSYGDIPGEVNAAPGQTLPPGYSAYGTPTPPPTVTPPPPGGKTGPPPPAGSGLVDPFTEPFNAPTPTPLPGVPQFKAPSIDEALNDPGYQFRLSQGENALQNWAAAKGTLNDSGTAKSLIDYGQNAGSQEYQNVWNRDWTAFQPNLLGYTTTAANTQHQNDMNYSNAWNKWLEDYAIFRNRQTDTVDASTKLS